MGIGIIQEDYGAPSWNTVQRPSHRLQNGANSKLLLGACARPAVRTRSRTQRRRDVHPQELQHKGREPGKCLKAHSHPPPVPMSNPRHSRQSSPLKGSRSGADAARRGEADFIQRVPLNLFHHFQLLPHQRGDIPRSLKPVSTTRDRAANAMVHWTSPQPLRILLRVVSPDLGRLMSLLRTGADWAPLA